MFKNNNIQKHGSDNSFIDAQRVSFSTPIGSRFFSDNPPMSKSDTTCPIINMLSHYTFPFSLFHPIIVFHRSLSLSLMDRGHFFSQNALWTEEEGDISDKTYTKISHIKHLKQMKSRSYKKQNSHTHFFRNTPAMIMVEKLISININK